MNYKTKNIYFGMVAYNLNYPSENCDYWTTPYEPFEQIEVDGEKRYRALYRYKNESFKEYNKNEKYYNCIKGLIPITSMIETDKLKQEISDSKIKLYLLKYKLKLTFSDKKVKKSCK